MKRHGILSFLAMTLLSASAFAAPLKIMTTTEDLAAIAREVAGDHAEIQSIARGYQDPHFVDAKPSYLLKLKRADLLIVVGLELEVGWLPSLLTNARNPKILPGSPGFLQASEGCKVLQRRDGAIDRSMGDIHSEGNPHYWLDPENGRVIARHVAAKLAALDPANATDYQTRLAAFEEKLTAREKEWTTIAEGFKGVKVITYHNSFPNFARAFNINVVNTVEPKPGIPPSPGHVRALLAQIRAEKIPLILVEPYFDDKLSAKIARDAGATLLTFPPSVGGSPAVKTYFDLFDVDLNMIADALAKRGGK